MPSLVFETLGQLDLRLSVRHVRSNETSVSEYDDQVMTQNERRLHIGVLVNPVAGMGGAVALKGSDGEDIQRQARERGAQPQAAAKAARALAVLGPLASSVRVTAWAGAMGEESLALAGMMGDVIGYTQPVTTSHDTILAARALRDHGVDLLLFAGGDGTARDMVTAVGHSLPVLGVPAGCKMHSGVYAVNPEAAGRLLYRLAQGEPLLVAERDVRDIDEDAFRAGQVRSRVFGSLRVPVEDRFVQQVKSGGHQDDRLEVMEMAAWVVDTMAPEINYLVGSGETLAEVMSVLGLPNTLLGVDWVCDGKLRASDLCASEILAIEGPVRALLTVIGGQGHLFGRGNQQFTPDVIRRIGPKNVTVMATPDKLRGLCGRPLLVDSGDPALDQLLCGLVPVVTGYEREVLYPVATIAGTDGACPQ